MKERLLRRDLPALQGSGLKAKNPIHGAMQRRAERTSNKETRSFELPNEKEKQFPVIQVEPALNILRPRNGSHSFVREASFAEHKPSNVRRERSQSNATNSSNSRPSLHPAHEKRKPVVVSKLKSFSERRPDLVRVTDGPPTQPTRAYALISNHISTSSPP